MCTCLCVLLQKNFTPLASHLSSVLIGSSSMLATMINRFLSRVSDSGKMITAPSQSTSEQLQSLLDTGKLSIYTRGVSSDTGVLFAGWGFGL